MEKDSLLVCTFDNGIRSCNATVYNFYTILVYLNFMELIKMPRTYTACWIRDYKTSKEIHSQKQLVKKLESEYEDLRISFFSHEPIKSFSKLIKLSQKAELPPLTYKSAAPLNLTVYTIWWNNGKPQITRSGINDNTGAVIDLFRHITTAYTKYYIAPSINSNDVEEGRDSYTSEDDEDAF